MNDKYRTSESQSLPDHRLYVNAGETYDFKAVEIRQLSARLNLIMMEYKTPAGETIPFFGVNPYPFQEEGGLTPTLRCYVKGFYPNGIAQLVQDKEWLLDLLYRDAAGTVASFTVTRILEDNKTGATYYELRDAFGVGSHRYYPGRGKACAVEGQQIELGIKELKGKFIELVDSSAIAKTPSALPVSGKFGSEDAKTEFKTSIVFSAASNGGIDPDYQLGVITKEIAAFLNAEGGTLYIGVDDHGTLRGVMDDFSHLNEGTCDEYNGSYKPTADGYQLKIRNAVKHMLGHTANGLILVNMMEEDGLPYCKIDIQPSPEPVYWRGESLYQRAGNQKQHLKGSEINTFFKLRMAEQLKEYISSHPRIGTIIPSERIIKPTIVTPVSASAEETWNHFTWYENGDFSIQRNPVTSDDVKLQIMIPKGYENERLVFCYANGCVNTVIPAKIRSGKTVRKRYRLWYCDRSELLAAFPAKSYDMLAVACRDQAGREFVKCHPLTHFGVTASLGAQGSSIIPTKGKQGEVVKYAKLDISEKNIIPNLVFEQNQTTTSIGIETNDIRYADEVKHLLKLMT